MLKSLLFLLLTLPLLAEKPILLPFGIFPPEVSIPLPPPELRRTGYVAYVEVPDQVKAVLFTLTRGDEVFTQLSEPVTTPNGRIATALFPIGINTDTPKLTTSELIVSKVEVAQ